MSERFALPSQSAPLTWEEACEEKLHELATQISPEEVDGGVTDGDIVLGYLKGEYAEREQGGDQEKCVFCDELRAPHEFKDGLRCVYQVHDRPQRLDVGREPGRLPCDHATARGSAADPLRATCGTL